MSTFFGLTSGRNKILNIYGGTSVCEKIIIPQGQLKFGRKMAKSGLPSDLNQTLSAEQLYHNKQTKTTLTVRGVMNKTPPP